MDFRFFCDLFNMIMVSNQVSTLIFQIVMFFISESLMWYFLELEVRYSLVCLLWWQVHPSQIHCSVAIFFYPFCHINQRCNCYTTFYLLSLYENSSIQLIVFGFGTQCYIYNSTSECYINFHFVVMIVIICNKMWIKYFYNQML